MIRHGQVSNDNGLLNAKHQGQKLMSDCEAVCGALRPYCDAMFQAVFVGNEQIDAQTCAEIASRIKLDARLFGEAIRSGAVNERVMAGARRAFERGAFGVPTFFVGDRMFWGNDRLVLLEHYFARRDRG
jgi:2-hydroxychromene-2-carboxylate isomerase